MYTRKNGRVTFRSSRRQSFKRNTNFSNGKVRNKGNITQQYQKYLKFAKEASSSGDRVNSEYYYQFADHYSRLMIELGIVLDEDINNQDSSEVKLTDKKNSNIQKSITDVEPITNSKDKKATSEDKKATSEDKKATSEDKETTSADEDSEHESIESVSFISQPVKKKSSKTKKESV